MLYDRSLRATKEYFKGKFVPVDGVQIQIDDKTANKIEFYLISNGYVDMDRKVTDKYHNYSATGMLAPLPDDIASMSEGVHKLVQAIFDERVLNEMINNAHETKVKENPLNDNFHKKEFQALWNQINHMYAYAVEFDSVVKLINAQKATMIVDQISYDQTSENMIMISLPLKKAVRVSKKHSMLKRRFKIMFSLMVQQKRV